MNEQREQTADRDAAERFVLWVLASLGWPAEPAGEGLWRVDVPEQRRGGWDGPTRLLIRINSAGAGAAAEAQPAAPGADAYLRLVEELRRRGAAVDAAPRRQPASVHELAPVLFEPFRVDGGAIHLLGCVLEDRPLLRLTYRRGAAAPPGGQRLEHVFFQPDASPLAPELRRALELDDLAPPARRPPRLDPDVVRRWIETARPAAERALARPGGEPLAYDLAAVVWCKWAEGKLGLTIGERTVESPFCGWAQLLAQRRIKPPPYACPLTGKQSYHVAAADDGTITVAEAIARCEHSGARVLETELETCAATGKRVLPRFLVTCPVSGCKVLAEAMVRCPQCGQRAAPQAMEEQSRCRACRELAPAAEDDPRLRRIVERYPRLRGWTHWRLSETAACYIVQAAGLLRRLLIVLDKNTLEPLRVAESNCWSRVWREADIARRTEWLGGRDKESVS